MVRKQIEGIGEMTRIPFRKREKRPDYLRQIKHLPCAGCERHPPSDPHHLKQGTGERGMAFRSGDNWAIPLCRPCHDAVENIGSKNEGAWFQKRGILPLMLAAELWAARKSLDDMATVLEKHRGIGFAMRKRGVK